MTEPHDKKYNIAMQRLIDTGQMPSRFMKLRVNEGGFPVPRFVQDVSGKPDFRVVNMTYLTLAIRHKLCWLCGEALGRFQCFAIGPMCAINRVSSEPPSHKECAEFAVKACPFMANPNRARNEHGLPPESENPAGIMIKRNPGVTLLWVTEDYRTFKSGDGILIKIGDPVETQWWAHGRHATREEIMESIAGGLPVLKALARREGPDAMRVLDEQVAIGLALVPT